MNHDFFKIIGITGGSGTGKSTVAKYLAQQGGKIIDADAVAREVVEPGENCLLELMDYFGKEILKFDGTLNRKALGLRVFQHPKELEKLNEITHKYIIERCLKMVEEEEQKEEAKFLILDAPLLFECNMNTMCHAVLVVLSEEERRIARIGKRDGLSQEEALSRIRAQQEDSFYETRGDFVVYNNGETNELFSQLDIILSLVLA